MQYLLLKVQGPIQTLLYYQSCIMIIRKRSLVGRGAEGGNQCQKLKQLQMELNQMCDSFHQEISAKYDRILDSASRANAMVENALTQKENVLNAYLDSFQNQLISIERIKEKDAKAIHRTNQDLADRRSRLQLIAKAAQMESSVMDKMIETLADYEAFEHDYDEEIKANNEQVNRHELGVEKYQRGKQESKLRVESSIHLDKEAGKMTLKIDPARGKVFEVFYNRKEDKFWCSDSRRLVGQLVKEFNFHRNIRKLYEQLKSI